MTEISEQRMLAEIAYQFCILPTDAKILVAGALAFEIIVSITAACILWRP